MNYLETVGKNAKKAFEDLKNVKHKKIKKVLDNYNQSLLKNSNKIIRENLKDVKNVKRKNLVDRLILNKNRIEGIRHSINEIAKFKDPIGRVLETWRRPNNLSIKNVIYISCNPKSLLEDLEHILKTHKIINLAVFDQFPWTEHLEVGVLMESHTKVQ